MYVHNTNKPIGKFVTVLLLVLLEIQLLPFISLWSFYAFRFLFVGFTPYSEMDKRYGEPLNIMTGLKLLGEYFRSYRYFTSQS